MDKRKPRIDRICTVIYVIVLIAYPLIRVSQGLYVGDTTYSPANFAFHDRMSGTWTVATYLANALGYVLMHLPGGDTLLGLNIWTSLVVCLTAVLPLTLLNQDISIRILFVGEMIALGLCWCPVTILYNYLTYLLFTAGALLLYKGIRDERWQYLAAAGACLGLNVCARLPNITEAALILVLWFAGAISHKKAAEILRLTAVCIAGYVAGFVIPWCAITVRYGISAYPGMIRHMFMMTDKATDYKPLAMVAAMFEDYLYAGRWILLWAAGAVICAVTGHFFKARPVRIITPVVIFGVIIRICYGQGMFTLHYYEYRAVYFWAVILLFFTTVMAVYVICRPSPVWSDPEVYRTKRIMSLMVLIIIYVTCIGSNNGLYPIVNNMFITAPYILWMVWDMAAALKRRDHACVYGMLAVMTVLLAGTFIQSVGFHAGYAFNDGIYGEARDSYVTGYERTAGIRTTRDNAQSLQGLMDYIYAHKTDGDSVILYGEIPGLGYLLDMPSALSTFWPSLDSYNYDEWEADMAAVYGTPGAASGDALPYIIVPLPVAAWESGDADAISYFGVDTGAYAADRKLADLVSVIHERGYVQTYVNDGYAVYESR